jgi:hypothetical protein
LLFWAAIWIGRGYIVRNRSSICQREGTTMSKHRAPSKERLAGALLLGAAASGALAIASLSGAGAANATCASISGVGNGNGCTSTATNFAVGLGPNTTATAANGVFNGALAVGNGATASAGINPTDAFNLSAAIGPGSKASTGGGVSQLALAVGTGSTADPTWGNNNYAFVIGNQSQAIAGGTPASPVSNTSAFVLGNNSSVNTSATHPVLVAIGNNKTLP